MRPTEILMNEHRVIEQVLDCLSKMAEEATLRGKLDGAAARDALDFFRHFADGCHHGKEEHHLFPLMEARGFPREQGPTGVMRYEHELGREQIRAMSAAIDGASAGQRAALDTFVKHARGYVELLRQHITKEDHCLFPMADHRLSAEDQDALLASFAATERDDMGEGTHERYLALAQKLAERFHVAPRSVGIAHACCGHR